VNRGPLRETVEPPGSESAPMSERQPGIAALVAGQVTSIFADRLSTLALIELVAAQTGRFARAGSVFELSKIALAIALPALVLGPLAGAYVDRARRKRVLVASNLGRCLAAGAIPLMCPALPMWTAYAMVGLLYACGLFFGPARCAIVPEIVARENLIRANSVLTVGSTLASIVGFGLGGILVSRLGWQAALALDSGCYLASAGLLAALRPRTVWARTGRGDALPYAAAIAGAIRGLRRLPAARSGVLVPPVLAAATTVAYVLGVALVHTTTQHGTAVIGLLVSAVAAGMAAGAYLGGTVLRNQPRDRMALAGAAVSIIALSVIAPSGPAVAFAAALLAGLGAGPVFVASETAIQEDSQPKERATTFAVRDVLMKTASAVAAVAAPAVAGILGLAPAMVVLLAALLPVLAAVALLARRRA
jgi:predicted MFS family arabinose efflux permease